MLTTYLRTITLFLRHDLRLNVQESSLPDSTFLPGVEIRGATIVFDAARLTHCGDLLHEAAHLALLPETTRRQHLATGLPIPSATMDGLELGAIAWSYAAAVHLKIPPEIVFHADGYHGRSAALVLDFSLGVFPGLMQLEAMGMALNPPRAAAQMEAPFPAMLRWLRA